MAMRLAIILLGLASSVSAAGWDNSTLATSADYATAEGWLIASSSAMSWPDGHQALITFWQRCYDVETETCTTVRCIDYFDANMRDTGSICYFPGRG
jgi:hypothetical protein